MFSLIFVPCLLLSAEPPQPRNGDKVLLVNDDGFSSFHSGRYRNAQQLQDAVAAYRNTQVAVLEWCFVAGSRVNFPSQKHELIGGDLTEFPRRGDKLATETLRRFRDEGEDTLAIVVEACKEAGIQCYASMRMNGDYPANAWEGLMAPYFNSAFWHRHPEFRQRDQQGKELHRMSYAYPEVRAFKLSLVREAIRRDVDGINLDFHRHPPFVHFEPPVLERFRETYKEDPASVRYGDPRWGKIRSTFLNRFMAELRELLDEVGKERGRRIGLSARIDWKRHDEWGCDVKTWLENDWLDYLVVGQYGLGGYEFDISPFVKLAEEAGDGCAVYFGEECITSGHDLTPKEDKLLAAGKLEKPKRGIMRAPDLENRASRWYAAGADGVHLFNLSDRTALQTVGSAKAKPASKTTASFGKQISESGIRHSFLIAGNPTAIVSEDGEIQWQTKGKARDAFVLKNGNILASISNRAQEISPGGKVVWSYALAKENKELGTAVRLDSGNTLVVERGANPRLLEISPEGKVAVEVPLQPETDNAHMQTRMARKLANGNYLVPHLLAFAVKEYQPDGTVVNTIRTDLKELGGREAKNWPFTAIRLANGNTLVNLTHGNKTVEFDTEGKVAWKATNEDVGGRFADPCGGQRLANGNTIICSYGQKDPKKPKLFEVTPDKKVVWEFFHPTARAHEVHVLTTNGKSEGTLK